MHHHPREVRFARLRTWRSRQRVSSRTPERPVWSRPKSSVASRASLRDTRTSLSGTFSRDPEFPELGDQFGHPGGHGLVHTADRLLVPLAPPLAASHTWAETLTVRGSGNCVTASAWLHEILRRRKARLDVPSKRPPDPRTIASLRVGGRLGFGWIGGFCPPGIGRAPRPRQELLSVRSRYRPVGTAAEAEGPYRYNQAALSPAAGDRGRTGAISLGVGVGYLSVERFTRRAKLSEIRNYRRQRGISGVSVPADTRHRAAREGYQGKCSGGTAEIIPIGRRTAPRRA